MTIKQYYYLTKPGIVYGNALAAAAGFLLAAQGRPDLLRFGATLLGLALVVASACVFNNVIDRDIDTLMSRTQRRALPRGQVSPRAALAFGSILGLLGAGLLAAFANVLAAAAALAGWILYVAIYTAAKRQTVYSTEIGSLSGAVPPVVGYAAVTGRLDLTAALLFAVLVIWQMPHFFAIAIFRHGDYTAAALPVLSVQRGPAAARRAIVAYMILLVLITPLFTLLQITGWTFLVETALINLLWLRLALATWRQPDEAAWARNIFKFSLFILLNFCLMWSVDAYLP